MQGTDIFRLDGRVALVTGAASGLGRAIAETYAACGANVVLADINLAGCQDVAANLEAEGAEALPLPCDLGDKTSVMQMVEQALAWKNQVDILVCCGGMEGYVGSLAEVSDEDWDRLMTVNLKSANWLSSALLPGMAERGWGRLIFIASIAGLRGNKAIGLYGLAKAGLSQLARNLAVDWGPSGVNVNAIAPGLIETPLSAHLMGNDGFMARRMALTPLRRVGRPEEVAGVVLMLASRAGGFITGQTLVVDGGTLITDGN